MKSSFDESKITLSLIINAWFRFIYSYHSAAGWLNRNRYFLDGKGYLRKHFYLSNLAERLTRHIECFPARFVRKWPNLVFGCFPRHWVNSGGTVDRKGATGKGRGIILISAHTAPSLHLRCRNICFKCDHEIKRKRFTEDKNILSTDWNERGGRLSCYRVIKCNCY